MSASLKHVTADGATQITGVNWPDAFAGSACTGAKFGVENNGDRQLTNLTCSIVQVGDNDGYTEMRIGLDTATLSKPWGLTLTLSGSGSGGAWGAAQNVYYVVTAIGPTGETIGSAEATVYVDDATKTVGLQWNVVTGAAGYKVYRATSSNGYTATSLRTTIGSGSTHEYVDNGGSLSAGAPPGANTTGGPAPNYGTIPTLDTVPLNIGTLAIGQQAFYWVNRVVPAGTDELGNPRQAELLFQEN